MSLLNLLQQAQGGQGLGQLASQFGIDETKANDLAAMLAPAIGSAAKQQAESGGLTSLLGSLRGEGQAAMFDDVTAASAPEGQAQGMEFLKGLMGGQQGADSLASAAADKSGLDLSMVQQFLPALAAMAQGGLQKNMPDAALEGMMPKQSGGLMGMVGSLLGGGKSTQGGGLAVLTNLLDANGDGSPFDDIMKKFVS